MLVKAAKQVVNNETDGRWKDDVDLQGSNMKSLTRMNVHALIQVCLLQHRFNISQWYTFHMLVSWPGTTLKTWARKANLPSVLMYRSLIPSSINVTADWEAGFLSNGCVTWFILFHSRERSACLCCSAGCLGGPGLAALSAEWQPDWLLG